MQATRGQPRVMILGVHAFEGSVPYAAVVCAQLTHCPLKERRIPVSLSLYLEAMATECSGERKGSTSAGSAAQEKGNETIG